MSSELIVNDFVCDIQPIDANLFFFDDEEVEEQEYGEHAQSHDNLLRDINPHREEKKATVG